MSIYCHSCGEKINEKSKFCPKCGTERLSSQDEGNNSSSKSTTNPTNVQDPDVTLFWVNFPPTVAYHMIWVGFVLVLLLAIVDPTSVWVGYVISLVGIWVDQKYATKVSEKWEPKKQWYTLGTFFLMIVTIPLYLYRRSKYV